MTIGKKIALYTTLMVAFAVLITATSVLILLNRGIETQTRELSRELERQSFQRIKAGKKILFNTIAYQIQRNSLITEDICRDTRLREPLSKGQWKAVFARVSEACSTADIDFMVIFDTRGRVVISYPDQMDEEYPEAHFKALDLFKSFGPAIAERNLTETPVVTSFEKWDQSVLRGYNIGSADAGDIVVLSAGVIPNDYFDEPIGYALSGIKSDKLSSALDHFFQITGQISMLVDKNIPLEWAGISGKKNEAAELFQLDFDSIRDILPDNARPNRVVLGQKAYHYLAAPLMKFSLTNEAHGLIRVSKAAEMCRIIVGEPVALIHTANDKILKEGRRIKKNILVAVLSIAVLVLVLTIFVMGLVSRRIARPISLAADMSGKIASGDLSHVLDESKTDETGILSRSMNRMVENLKDLEDRNREQMQALKEREKRNKSIVDLIQDGVLLIDAKNYKVLEANPAALKMIGAARHEIVGHRCSNSICPENIDTFPVTDTGQIVLPHAEHLLRTKDGRHIEVLKTILTITLDNRRCLLETIVDLSRIKQAEAALRDSERRFRMLFNTSHQAIALVEAKTGCFIDVNDKLCEMSKFKHTEIMGKTSAQLGFFSPDDEAMFTEQLIHKGEVHDLEMDFYTKDGSPMNIRFHAVPLQIKDENFFLTEFYDITENRRLESQLKQSLKMESIGTLAGGIAHDFNNILGIILGNTELALEDVASHHPVHENLDAIKKVSLRAAEIVSQLLSYSRRSGQVFEIIDIVPVVHEAFNLLRSSIPSTVHINSEIEDPQIPVLADPTQINQIIMNLCINAYQSMEGAKGIIDIGVRITEVDLKKARANKELSPGKYAQIVISDDGSGIPAKFINRIFDPYFTTKEVGKGSGMGLAIVAGIIKNHNGAIFVDSHPGKGTWFSIYLPLADERPAPKTDVEPGTIFSGTGTILFVDDEKSTCKLFKDMLTRIGYRVATFTNPVEALVVFKSDPHYFDLVITDMTMPDMTGADLTKALMASRYDIPIIICTGHSEFMDEQKAKELGVAAFVRKPVRVKEFLPLVHRILAAHHSPGSV